MKHSYLPQKNTQLLSPQTIKDKAMRRLTPVYTYASIN